MGRNLKRVEPIVRSRKSHNEVSTGKSGGTVHKNWTLTPHICGAFLFKENYEKNTTIPT
jgi:hypothetical protein